MCILDIKYLYVVELEKLLLNGNDCHTLMLLQGYLRFSFFLFTLLFIHLLINEVPQI